MSSGDASDDVVPYPPFRPGRVEGVPCDAEAEDDSDVFDEVPGHAAHSGGGGPAAEDAGAKDRAGEDVGDHRGRRARVEGDTSGYVADFDVIDRCHGDPVAVEDLPVQKMQLRVADLTVVAGGGVVRWVFHSPAPVMIIKGIAATEAMRMMTRKIIAIAFVARPLTSLPMYCLSFATIRMGR